MGLWVRIRIRRLRVAYNKIHSISKGMGLVRVVSVPYGKTKRVKTGLTAPIYAKRDGAERSVFIVSRRRKSPVCPQPLPFAAVGVRSTVAPVQYVETVVDRGEFVIVVTVVVIILVDAGKIIKTEAGFQILSPRHSISDQIRIYERR